MGIPRAPDPSVALPSPAPPAVRSRPIGSRCGAAEVLGVVAVIAVALATLGGPVPLATGVAIALLVPPAVVDVREQRLPDVWIATALIGLVVTLSAEAAFGGAVDLVGVAAGALVMFAPVVALHLASPAAMGFGDVKLSIVLGGALGAVDWRLAMVALSTAGLLGATYGIASRRRTVPFGPFLVGGSLLTLLVGDSMLASLVDAGTRS